LSRYKNILVLVAVLIGQVIGLAIQVRKPNPNGGDQASVRLIRYWAIGVISPIEKILHGGGSGLRGMWSNYLDLRHVRDQNRQLKEQLSRLQLEQAGLLEDARQGQRLQALLAFKEHYINQTIPAQVVGTSGSDQSRILYIDKGAKDGLKPDMAVITPDGIVGKLKDVYAHTSQVLVINDQTSGAGVLLESTRLRGVLRGNDLGQPEIINMLPDERVKPGERVITSGGDQIYPRGLPVGIVDRVVPDSQNPPYVNILIKPAANLGHLEELLVISQDSDRMPASEQQDLAQSAAEGAAVSRQRAADILAERLPGLSDSNALADAPGQKPAAAAAPAAFPALHPPPALHPDHFTPQATPPAHALTPGQAVVDPKYGPAPETRAASESPSKAPTASKVPQKTDTEKTDTGTATTATEPKAKRPAAAAPAASEDGSPAPASAKPKPPKVKAPAPPADAVPQPSPANDGGQPR
jgi:rod shape-determining protein MreC